LLAILPPSPESGGRREITFALRWRGQAFNGQIGVGS